MVKPLVPGLTLDTIRLSIVSLPTWPSIYLATVLA
jgi:hypothetical protein